MLIARSRLSSIRSSIHSFAHSHWLAHSDLLDHTPATSPSRALVERAYESALRIAKKCDRAQAHAAFLRQSASTPNSNPNTKSEKQAARTRLQTNTT